MSEMTPAPDRSARPWKIATAATAVVGVIAAGTVYVVMDRQVDDVRTELAATRAELDTAQDDPLGGLGDLLGGLGGDEGLGGLEDLLGGLGGGEGLGGLEDLLGDLGGDALGGMGDLDPNLIQCLMPEGFGMNTEGSIPEGDIEAQVAAVADLVRTERGVDVDPSTIDIEFVPIGEVQRRAVDINSRELDAEAAAADSAILAALGAVEPGTDLVAAQLDALEAGVGGFYDPESKQLVIGSESMDGLGAMITSHELVHAMTDATFGLPDIQALEESQGSDAAYAALNAIEGDASLYGQRFVASHVPIDALMALQSTSAGTQAQLDSMPHFVARELGFPYLEGMTFTCDVFQQGDWAAVDGTYSQLPATTAQILFPDRYRSGEAAVDVRDPAGLDGWQQIDSDTFGAADLLFLLEAPGDDEEAALSDPKERVAAWAGGEVNAWSSGDQHAVALVLADRGDATPLCDTVTEFYGAAFPDAARGGEAGATTFEADGQAAVVTCAGTEVALGIGPDLGTARAAIG